MFLKLDGKIKNEKSINLKMKSQSIFYKHIIIIFLILLSCNEDSQCPIVSNKDELPKIDSLTEDGVILLDLLSSDFQSLIVADAFSTKYDCDRAITLSGKISNQILILLEDINSQINIVSNGSIPKESNFDVTNAKIDQFNDLISENFLFSIELKGLVLVKRIDYESFVSNSLIYLNEKKLMILTSANFVLMQLMKEYRGIKTKRID